MGLGSVIIRAMAKAVFLGAKVGLYIPYHLFLKSLSATILVIDNTTTLQLLAYNIAACYWNVVSFFLPSFVARRAERAFDKTLYCGKWCVGAFIFLFLAHLYVIDDPTIVFTWSFHALHCGIAALKSQLADGLQVVACDLEDRCHFKFDQKYSIGYLSLKRAKVVDKIFQWSDTDWEAYQTLEPAKEQKKETEKPQSRVDSFTEVVEAETGSPATMSGALQDALSAVSIRVPPKKCRERAVPDKHIRIHSGPRCGTERDALAASRNSDRTPEMPPFCGVMPLGDRPPVACTVLLGWSDDSEDMDDFYAGANHGRAGSRLEQGDGHDSADF